MNNMRLNKETQYALLLGMYLARSGRSTIETVVANLNLSKSFLHKVAHNLRRRGILESTRGPGGGFALAKDVRIIDIFNSIDGNGFLSQRERLKLATGVVEERMLELIVSNMGLAIWPVINKTLKQFVSELTQTELKQLNTLTAESLEQ
jgi:Rrf2 family protein